MKQKFLVLALSGFVLLGCDKEDDDKESEKTGLLVQQAWKFETAGIDMDKNGTLDATFPAGTLQPCLTDNTITFAANGSGTVAEGATKCDPAAPDNTPFTWSFASNETAINFTGNVIAGTEGGQFKIVNLTSTQLSLSKDTSYMGVPVAMIANFTH